MGATVVYEIASYDGPHNDARLLERVQLVSTDAGLLLRAADGSETPCAGSDVVAVVAATPSLREIRAGDNLRITCTPEVAAQLPFALNPKSDGEDPYVEVNGDEWMAYPTIAGGDVMLPTVDDLEPLMTPCWASYRIEDGYDNPLLGETSIGLATPGAVVEYGWHDYGGISYARAVQIRRFDDFATRFIHWLTSAEVLCALWQDDSFPTLPAWLFAAAVADTDHKGSRHIGPDNDADDGTVRWETSSLSLDLSDDLIELVLARLSTDPKYVQIVKSQTQAD
ncbi:hypothetical protein [Mycolicibacter sinensis]|uniref:Uncharacterized protein n=1 Tax=Mycolicibacter sinensis (strain JDM601) TaxID=875328 RepID=A0A1A3TUN2_MYCSD|nr:hypothetical protein [Mycolicibacter sinensis]OBK86353.1 hypothetical protein A5648_05900 [Mycolicibacter sinensis]